MVRTLRTLRQEQSGSAQIAPSGCTLYSSCQSSWLSKDALHSLGLSGSPVFLVPSCMRPFQGSPSILGARVLPLSYSTLEGVSTLPLHPSLLCLLRDPRSQYCPQLPPVSVIYP